MSSRLTPYDHQRIDAAVAAIERVTAADLDIVLTQVSARYRLYPVVWAGFSALVITGAAVLLWPALNGRNAIFIQLLILVALTALLDWLPIRLALVPRRVKHAHARQLARREFAAHAADGADRKRILLFVSLGEHYVEIIADHGTHAALPGQTWDKVVADFASAAKAGRAADGLMLAIEACGTVLKTHHPKGPADGPTTSA